MISDKDAENAIAWIKAKAEEAANARSSRIFYEESRKAVLARIAKRIDKGFSEAKLDRVARGDDEYMEHLMALREAVFVDEKYRRLYEAAQAQIDIYRTQESSRRERK